MKQPLKLNVLFVEDDQVDQMALERMATRNDIIASYEFSDSVAGASALLNEHHYDVIVTDYHLRDGVGMDVLKKSGNIPVIVVTGMGDEKLAVEAMKSGAVDYMVKDPDSGHLEILPLSIAKAYEQFANARAYKEAEERYHDLFEHSTDLIQSVDPKGNFIYVNPRWLKVLGYKEKEVQKMNLVDIIHPEHKEHCQTMFENLLKGVFYGNEEIWFLSKKGKKVVVEGNVSCKLDELGNPIATRGIFRDVTESRKVENQLKESEKQYRLLVESANDIIYYGDPYGNLKFINNHGPAFTGYTHKELLGIHFVKLVDPEYSEEVAAFYKNQFEEKSKNTYHEFPILRKDKTKLWVGQSVRTLFDESDPNRIIGYLGVVRDIDNTKKMEEQLRNTNQILEKRVSWRTRELEKINSQLRKEIDLRTRTESALIESEEEYRNLFQNAHDAIVICDPVESKVLEANSKACEIYGYSRQQLIGMSVTKVNKLTKKEANSQSKEIKSGRYINYQTKHWSNDGKEMTIAISATRIIYKGKEAILCINQDITEKLETDRKLLEERTRRMTALIDGQELERKRLSRELHDGLGQLLTASLIYLKQLYKSVNEKKAEKLIDTTREILEKTIGEVRTISHNLMPSVLDDFGLELALKNMVNSINGNFDGKLRFQSSGYTRLKQDVEIGLYRIAQEALNNALKYAGASRIDINLTAEKDGTQTLVIKDNGKGFDPKKKLKAKSGNGIYNMNQRSRLIDCNFNIISSPQKGTKVVVQYNPN